MGMGSRRGPCLQGHRFQQQGTSNGSKLCGAGSWRSHKRGKSNHQVGGGSYSAGRVSKYLELDPIHG